METTAKVRRRNVRPYTFVGSRPHWTLLSQLAPWRAREPNSRSNGGVDDVQGFVFSFARAPPIFVAATDIP